MTIRNLEGARLAAQALLSRIKEVSAPDRGRQAYLLEAFLDTMNAGADPASAERVIRSATNGDGEAKRAIGEAIEPLLNEGPLPEALRPYVARLVRGEKVPTKPGQSPHNNHLRDQLIVLAVRAVVSYGFKPRRSNEDNQCACSIVSEVMAKHGVHMSVEAVEKIWTNRTTR